MKTEAVHKKFCGPPEWQVWETAHLWTEWTDAGTRECQFCHEVETHPMPIAPRAAAAPAPTLIVRLNKQDLLWLLYAVFALRDAD